MSEALFCLCLDVYQGPSSSQGGGRASESQQASEKQLIVLEELPFQGSDKAASSFGGALSCFLHESRHPGVIVLTDENEDKGSLETEKRLPREVLQSPLVSQIRCNPVTDGETRDRLRQSPWHVSLDVRLIGCALPMPCSEHAQDPSAHRGS